MHKRGKKKKGTLEVESVHSTSASQVQAVHRTNEVNYEPLESVPQRKRALPYIPLVVASLIIGYLISLLIK